MAVVTIASLPDGARQQRRLGPSDAAFDARLEHAAALRTGDEVDADDDAVLRRRIKRVLRKQMSVDELDADDDAVLRRRIQDVRRKPMSVDADDDAVLRRRIKDVRKPMSVDELDELDAADDAVLRRRIEDVRRKPMSVDELDREVRQRIEYTSPATLASTAAW